MATVNASKYGIINGNSELGFSTARTLSSGQTVFNQPTSTNYNVVKMTYTAGAKGNDWSIRRHYLAFDVSAYATGYTITNLKLYYVPTTSTSGSSGAGLKIAIIKQTAQGDADTDLTVSDYYTPLDYGVDYADNDGTDIWADSTSLSYFDLNATAITAFSSSYVKLAIVEYISDYNNSAPSSAQDYFAFGNFSSTVPYLSFTATATGYGNDVIGVSSANIDSVNAVATADISEIIGV